MRFPSFLVVATCSFLLFSQGPKKGNSEELHGKGLKMYAVEKGMIVFDVEGQPNDTLVVAFDRFGWRQVTMEHGEKLYYGLKTKINTKEIVDGHTTFTMNLKDKKGRVKFDKSLSELAAYKSPEELLEARMAKFKATKTGHENILDKACSTWEYESRGKKCKIWVWNGVFLKHVSPSGTRTALQLDLAPELNEKLFIPPEDVALTYPN